MGNPKQTEKWLRRQAIQLAAQLPETEDEALLVLNYARELVVGFMEGRETKAGRQYPRSVD